MAWKINLLYFVVTVILTSLKLCDGQAEAEEEADMERPTVQGSHHLRSVVSGLKLEPEAQTRPGSLSFKYNRRGDSNPTNEAVHDRMDNLARLLHIGTPPFREAGRLAWNCACIAVNWVKGKNVFSSYQMAHFVSQHSLAAKLKHLDPSVQCSDNRMTLTVRRIGAPRFLVDSGEESLTPLSQMPSTCGFSVKRSRRDVQYAANYQGCHVNKQDGDYILPLRLFGTPMTMSCPVMLPSPSIFCFPSRMVVTIGGVAANELKVKMSGTWQPLSSACSSCGLKFKEFVGELTLSAPYNTGSCVEVKDEEYLLTLQWADFELEATCPPVPNTEPTGGTMIPPSDGDQVLQNPHYPYFPMFSQYLEPPPTHSPAQVASWSQSQLSSVAGAAENQPMFAAQHPGFSFMPRFPPFFLIPRSEAPAQPPANQGTASPPAQLLQMPQSPQYRLPVFPQFQMVPGPPQSTTPAPPPASPAETLVTTPAPTTGEGKKPETPGHVFSVSQYPFHSFPKHPSAPEGPTRAIEDPKPVTQKPKPQNLYPQSFQIPVFHPLPNHQPPRQNELQAPASTPTRATTTDKPLTEKPFYQPHPFMPVYFVPKQGPMPVFLNSPAKHSINPAPSNQHEHQPIYRPLNPLYSLLPDQRQKPLEGSL